MRRLAPILLWAWLLSSPTRALAESSIQRLCAAGACALITAGTGPGPSSEVEATAKSMRPSKPWTKLREGRRITAPEERTHRATSPFTHTARRALDSFRVGDLEAARRVLLDGFFDQLPSIAPWADYKLQDEMAYLCHQLVAATPPAHQLGVARICMIHLPELMLVIRNGKGPKDIQHIYQQALEDRAVGHVQLLTDAGCEIAVAGWPNPTNKHLITDPLPGLYSVTVSCGGQVVLFPVDAHTAVTTGDHQIYLAALSHLDMDTQPTGTPHLQLGPKSDLYERTRSLLAENRIDAIVVVHAEPKLEVEVIGLHSIGQLPLPSAVGTPSRVPPNTSAETEAAAPTRTRSRAAIALGAGALATASTAWALAVWSSSGPTQDLIDTAKDMDIKQAEYDRLETRWRHTRLAMHATGSLAIPLADLALFLGRDRLREAPVWMHWTIGALGAGAATLGAIGLVRSPKCETKDPRLCADDTFKRDRAALLLYLAIPLLSEPMIAMPWKARISLEGSSAHATLKASWSL